MNTGDAIYSDLIKKAYGSDGPDASHFSAGFLVSLVNALTILAFAFGILGIALAFFLFVTSGGKPEQVKKASSALIFSVVAAAIGLTAGSLARIIFGPIGFSDYLGIGF